MQAAAWRAPIIAGVFAGMAACAPVMPPLEDTPTSATPAVLTLADTASTRQADGDYESAAAALERALRLEPRNPRLWHQLAGVRLEQRRWSEAESLAMRSLSLSEDERLVRANWEVIEQARRGAGDLRGAREAAARLREL